MGYRGLTRENGCCSVRRDDRAGAEGYAELTGRGSFWWRKPSKMDRAFDRMPMRWNVRLEGALGSCEFCTGQIQLTARRLI